MVNEPLLSAGLKNSTSRMWPWEGQDRKVEGTEYARKLAEPSQSPYAGVQKGDSYAYITSFPKSLEIKMNNNKMKFAQDIMKKHSGGNAMGGFNTRVLGHTSNDLYRHKDFEGVAGWNLADGMIRDGKLFYVHNFHTKGRCHAFPYGGTWVCNDCNRDHLDKPWWKIKVFEDGDAWCCVGEEFEDLQESDNYAFGDTRDEAVNNYGDLMADA